MSLLTTIEGLGGLAATHELLAVGWSKYSLAVAVSSGAIIRVRQGWYCLPTEPEQFIRAVRVGGRLGCVSAARAMGLAVRNTPILHVAVTGHGSRLRSPLDRHVRLSATGSEGVVTHWTNEVPSGTRFMVGVRSCLVHMATCLSPEWVVAAVDSAIRLGLLTRADWHADIAHLPRRLRRLLANVNPVAESITESVARFRLEALGIELSSQVRISGVGRVDFLIGTSLVIEFDGYTYHAERERFEADRRRDARLSVQGYRVLRFSYSQVMQHWSEVKDAIRAAIARGDHLAR